MNEQPPHARQRSAAARAVIPTRRSRRTSASSTARPHSTRSIGERRRAAATVAQVRVAGDGGRRGRARPVVARARRRQRRHPAGPRRSAVGIGGRRMRATIDPDAAADALAVGKPAPLQFTMKDMNGDRRQAGVVQGQGDPAELLGDVVRSVPRGDSVAGRAAAALRRSARGSRRVDRRSAEQAEAVRHRDAHELSGAGRARTARTCRTRTARCSASRCRCSSIATGEIWKRHSGIASKEQFEREIKALL